MMDIRSNEPFWLVKNGIKHAYPSLRESATCEVLVVGAGITGALMAHALIKKGYDTILIDKREIAYGSTSATTSMLQYEIDVPLYQLKELIGEQGAIASYKACRDAIYKLENLVQEIGSECSFEKKESVYFAGKSKDVAWLKKEYEARKLAGFEVKWLEKKEIKAIYGLLAEGAILSAEGGSVDAFCLAHDLIHYNVEKGLKVFDKTALKKVKYEKNGVTVLLDTGAEIKAGKIIYCTGYETQNMLPDKVVDLKSTYAMISERGDVHEKICEHTLFWNTDKPYLYMRTTDEGRMLVGGEDENFKNAIRRDLLLNKKRDKLMKTLKKYLPETKFIEDFCWCGTFGETKDGLPYIGAHPKFADSYFLLGFGGNGITFSVTGADMITEMMEGRPDLLSHYFRFQR
ncbi:glycine/D-amino acid oxidase-like deaminating enzyme [Pedobacter sp. AK017]|uniref:NAD(P)/FAD-dependent oxidoreductase n=1 Tax=Pedobacter sp. AK017 TaxID=2723073 RepID=UPI00182A5FDB|nr:FAD-dependent oxidoreductase [Pedobacter sp. AK017]MBB5437228.1 glycine/D-amino acid oxidase-like deaminating enzyme [Pedobacter sp. AK017]